MPDAVKMIRRNGMLGSCEACRKAKVRCDHRTPTCGTCEVRSIACEYHPAPMTQPRSPTVGIGKSVSAYVAAVDGSGGWFGTLDLSKDQTSTVADASPGDTQPLHPRTKRRRPSPMAPSAKYPNAHLRVADGADSTDSITTAPDHTYYGSTSSVSTFQDAAASSGQEDSDTATASCYQNNVTSDTAAVELGCWIVAQLKHVNTICALAERYMQATLVSPVATLIPVETIRTLKQVGKTQIRTQIDRQKMARSITSNSSKHIQVHTDLSVRNYLALFVGENLRWEFIALVCAWAGGAATDASPSSNDLALPPGFSPASFTQRMMKCSNACITLQQQHTCSSSDMLVWSLYANLILLTYQYGESSHQAWRRLGDLSTEIFASGLHRVAEQPHSVPAFLVQARKKIFHASYNIDKLTATYFGRPPRIPNHYCSTPLPFDVDDRTFFDELSQDNVTLDTNAWNKDSLFYPATWIRVRSMISQVKENVLETVLNPQGPTVSTDAEALLERSQEVWQSLPEFLQYSADCWASNLSTRTCTCLLLVYLEHLHNQFHLRRYLSHNQLELSTRDALLEVSMQILQTAIALPGSTAKRPQISQDRTWVLLHYAVSSAAVTANEIRLRTQRGESLPSWTSRSQAIRHISVLISMLEATTPSAGGNSDLSDSAAKKLAQILSDVLDNPVPVANSEWICPSPFSLGMFTDSGLDLLPDWSDSSWAGQATWSSLLLP